jgi:hypothetical protein
MKSGVDINRVTPASGWTTDTTAARKQFHSAVAADDAILLSLRKAAFRGEYWAAGGR